MYTTATYEYDLEVHDSTLILKHPTQLDVELKSLQKIQSIELFYDKESQTLNFEGGHFIELINKPMIYNSIGKEIPFEKAVRSLLTPEDFK